MHTDELKAFAWTLLVLGIIVSVFSANPAGAVLTGIASGTFAALLVRDYNEQKDDK